MFIRAASDYQSPGLEPGSQCWKVEALAVIKSCSVLK